MRRLLTFIVAVLFVTSCFVGCGSKPADQPKEGGAEQGLKDAGKGAEGDAAKTVDDAKKAADAAAQDAAKKADDLKKGITDK